LATLIAPQHILKEAATFESRTAQRETNVIREVFISATAKDASNYRQQVGDALAQLAVAVFLQEYWAFAAHNVVDLCLTRLAESDAYLGVFGFRYGWIPDKQVKSITELECDKALQLWGNTAVPPVFWFMPEPNSEAATLLEAGAAAVLAVEYPHDAHAREQSRLLQKSFCDRLRGMNRFVTSFSTIQMLRERAMAAVSNWNQVILKAAAERSRSAVAEIPPGELGAIDREDQREAIEDTLIAAQNAMTPGLCVVVHGDETAGQFQFLAFLEQENLWDISARPRLITPSHDQFDAASLAGAAFSDMAPGQTVQTSIFDDLATALADGCRTESVVMFVSVDRLTGGLEAFRTGFWLPLMAAAEKRAETGKQQNPFIVVLRTSSVVPSPAGAGLIEAPSDDTADYRNLVVLPALGPFTAKDVSTWLGRLDVKLKDRKAIADRVIGDGIPRGVFDRLNSDGFWTALNR
jgi:hypothetical protein